jgi:hypothetical protein
VNQWQHYLDVNNGNVQFTYNIMKRQYPWLKYGIRRYMTKPNYYVKNAVEIDAENIEEAVLSTYDKDFSNKVKQELVSKYRRVMDRTKKNNKQRKKGLFGGAFRGLFNWSSNRGK